MSVSSDSIAVRTEPHGSAGLQCADAVFLVRPAAFGYNEQTAASNALQNPRGAEADPAPLARAESDALAAALRAAGVAVCVGEDSPVPRCPDAVFPNNWLSLHRDGIVVVYPMQAPNRRLERRMAYLQDIAAQLGWSERGRVDLSPHERDGRFLEGTGSLVLDHVLRRAYACRSVRTDEALVREWGARLGFETVVFDACDPSGRPYYHTNVMLSIGSRAVVAALDGVPPRQAEQLRGRLQDAGREIVDIDAVAVAAFAGNLLELTGRNERGEAQQYWVMSRAAQDALGPARLARLVAGGERVLSVAVPMIERLGGGSVRCMLAEVPRGAR